MSKVSKVEISKHNGGNSIHVGFLFIETLRYQDVTVDDVGSECIHDLVSMASNSTIPIDYRWTGDEVFEVTNKNRRQKND